MEFRRVLALRGPNIWVGFPVLETLVDLGRWQNPHADETAAFERRLGSWLPTIASRCDEQRRERLLATPLALRHLPQILVELTLGLQTYAGAEVRFGKVQMLAGSSVHRLIVEYESEKLARECLIAARELCLAALADADFDLQREASRLRELADRICLGPSTRSIVRAAQKRGIPIRRLNDESLVQLGHGARQRRFRAAETDRTNAIAEGIAQDKELTKILLRAVGVPVPEGRPATSEEDAWLAACEVGVPVVVKPRDANHGRGVALNLTRREQVVAAYTYALEEGSGVLVERFALGAEHRLLVVGDQVVAAMRGEPEQVVGDGTRTLKQLVDDLNDDPRRGLDYSFPLGMVRLDPIALLIVEQQGYSPDSVPAARAKVVIHHNGEYTTDETDEVHPEVAAAAVMAARVVGLDIAGIDLIVEDIGRPLDKQGGAIVEVNAGPSLQMHLEPLQGVPRPVGEAIVATLYPENQNGRIPIVAVTESPANSLATRWLAHLMGQTGRKVGFTNAQGMFVGSRRIAAGDCREASSARSVLINPLVEAAVFEVARQSVLLEGLGFDACSTAVILGGGDNSADEASNDMPEIESLEALEQAFLHALLPDGCLVLAADAPSAADLAERFDGSLVVFAQLEKNMVVERQRSRGGRTVVVRDQKIVLAEGGREQQVGSLSSLPILKNRTTKSSATPLVDDVLAAVAAAWAMGINVELIRGGLESFRAAE